MHFTRRGRSCSRSLILSCGHGDQPCETGGLRENGDDRDTQLLTSWNEDEKAPQQNLKFATTWTSILLLVTPNGPTSQLGV